LSCRFSRQLKSIVSGTRIGSENQNLRQRRRHPDDRNTSAHTTRYEPDGFGHPGMQARRTLDVGQLALAASCLALCLGLASGCLFLPRDLARQQLNDFIATYGLSPLLNGQGGLGMRPQLGGFGQQPFGQGGGFGQQPFGQGGGFGQQQPFGQGGGFGQQQPFGGMQQPFGQQQQPFGQQGGGFGGR
jgi:hypothetical protein